MAAKGRAYTMKEMKGIVEYLTDHGAYNEIRGRKMWMDYASSGLTSRTWQSLKETFLKRILPDIYNPYFKLSMDQIRSFRMGQDFTNKNVNKLEVHTATDNESSSKDKNPAGGPSTSYNVTKEEGNTSGEENNQVSKITSSRESVETVILSTGECYDDAELLKVLESPTTSPKVQSADRPKKTMSLRDCITYSEPLTPLLQEIVDDFESEPEDNILEPKVILTTQIEPLESNPEQLDSIDLTEGSEGDVEGPQTRVKEEVPNNKVTENEIVSEVSEISTKKSLKLKKGDQENVSKPNKRANNLSTETNSTNLQELENNIPEEVNQQNVMKPHKKTKSQSTESKSSDVQEVDKNVTEEINKDNVSKPNKKNKSGSTEIKSSDVQEVDNNVTEEINKDNVSKRNKKNKSGSTESKSSDVQEVDNNVQEKINKSKVSKPNKRSKSRSTESKSSDILEVENNVAEDMNSVKITKPNKKTKNISTKSNSSDVQEVLNTVPGEINKLKVTKGNKKTKNLSTETNSSDLHEVENTVPEDINEGIVTKRNRETINLSIESNSPDVQEVGIALQEEINKEKAPDTNKEPATDSIKTNESLVQVIESQIAFKTGDAIPLSNYQLNKSTSEFQNINKTVENSSSTITDSLLPNNQEALHEKKKSKEPRTHEKEESGKITNKKDSSNEKTEKHEETTEKENNEAFKKSHKRQRKLYSTSDSNIALKVKKVIDEVNEIEDEQPSTAKKLKTIDENTTNYPTKTSDKTNILENNNNRFLILGNTSKRVESPKTAAKNSKDPVETQQNDIMDSQDTHQSSNPCLQSVSLFAEQFIPLKSESEDDDSIIRENPTKRDQTKEKQKVQNNVDSSNTSSRQSGLVEADVDPNLITNRKDIVILKSHSESETTEDIQITRKPTHRDTSRSQKKDVLSHLFGNTSGGVTKKRLRKSSYINGSVHRKKCIRMSSESSEWLSESDDEYVSPPRSRHRNTKRYLRPQSSRILQMGQEGALFVAVGKKVYPLVRDDGRAVSYVNYVSGSESEENDSYWKLKYVKERKKNDDLSKLLENANDEHADRIIRPQFNSPILPTKSSKNLRHISGDGEEKSNAELNGTEVLKQPEKQLAIKEKEVPKQETVKIKFAKDNEEVFLEGHWQNLHTILSDVMQVFKKDVSAKSEASPNVLQKKHNPNSPIEVSSGKTTPVIGVIDEEVHKKVDELENQIFKEIEEIDKSDRNLQVPIEAHVTQRKRGHSKNPSVDSPQPSSSRKTKRTKTSDTDSVSGTTKKSPKPSNIPEFDTIADSIKRKSRRKVSAESETAKLRSERISENLSTDSGSKVDSEIIVNESRLQLIESEPATSRRRHRPPTKLSYDNNSTSEPRMRQKKAREPATIPDDSQVLYKFPSPEPVVEGAGGRISTRASRTKKYLPGKREIYTDINQNSVESSQGYQDSDFSPKSENFKRKKKYTLPAYRPKSRNKSSRNSRRHTFNNLHCEASSESSNSNFRFPIRNITVTNSSLNTEVYRSDSYQLLMAKPRYFYPLDRITESPCPNEMDPKCGGDCLRLSPATQNLGSRSELGNSSSVSLPLSPELSIVENISVCKNELESHPRHPTINETISNVEMKSQGLDTYVISNLDVSVPLMQQKCDFRIYQDVDTSNSSEAMDQQNSVATKALSQSNENPSSVTGATVTESLLDRMDTARIEENITTNDLDMRLTKLLLESAKKITAQNEKATGNSDKENVEKKKNSKKRCSTPRKKREIKKSKTPVEPVIEECMEYCHSGRKSCPPVICENSVLIDTTHTITDTKKTKTGKSKSPKEIIKIKILRPKKKNEPAPKRPNTRSQSRLSVLTDSGINDTSTSLLLQSMNESVELIHNHSETCLHAHECLSTGVASVEKSVLSVDTSSVGSKDDTAMKRRRSVRNSMTPEFFCCDAQSASSLDKSSQKSSLKPSQTGTQYLSAQCSSLMTDDLSDEAPPPHNKSKNWFLLSEDESTNTLPSFAKPASCSVSSSFGSNLRQIFPVICSVPDLSDITEFSRETDANSLKSTRNTDLDSNMRSEFLLSDFNDEFIVDSNGV